jgi:hypothetical protein
MPNVVRRSLLFSSIGMRTLLENFLEAARASAERRSALPGSSSNGNSIGHRLHIPTDIPVAGIMVILRGIIALMVATSEGVTMVVTTDRLAFPHLQGRVFSGMS